MFCFRFSLFSTNFAAAAHPSDQNPNFALPKTQKIDHVIVQHGDQKRLHPQSAKASQNKSISDLPSSGLLLLIENNSSTEVVLVYGYDTTLNLKTKKTPNVLETHFLLTYSSDTSALLVSEVRAITSFAHDDSFSCLRLSPQ